MRRAAIVFGVGIVAAHLWLNTGGDSRVDAQQDSWTTAAAQKHGLRLVESRDPGGPPAYPAAAGDLLFFTNSGTTFGATNTRNSVVVIDARSKKPIAVSGIETAWSEGFVSHGIGVSPDGKYVYLPGQAPNRSKNPSGTLVLDARTLKIAQIIASRGERPHHVKNFVDWTGTPRVLVEEFNWTNSAPNGQGFYVLDFKDRNKVLGGMTPGELRGNPYTGFVAPDGRYLYFGVVAPDVSIRGTVNGWLAKIDMQTWKVVQHLAIPGDPTWTVFSQDGKFAWVSMSYGNKVLKIERAAGGGLDKIAAEVPTGPGPYGLAMNIDDTELWVADKGEGTSRAQRKTTVTVSDAASGRLTRTIETGCVTNDHLILSPEGGEMWAMCNGSQEIVVLDTRAYAVKTRIPMPNQGDAHGGSFVAYRSGPGGLIAEVVSDQSGLQGSARAAARERVP
ncbi:MAG: hypothetical protein A3H29_02385 [Acidobacteria bacterium RIFCSPLOWO2_02_FULL_67_21]|nr:MAG: hypothetical protein A3H29_02385 [Acidobacteria bacterium RIFCSPLOWO2_02_FULL_67_21]